MDYLTTHTSPIRRGFAPGCVNYKKGCTRLAAESDKIYQLLAHGRWFSPGTPASSTTKTGRHDIAEILLKVVLKHQKSNQNHTTQALSIRPKKNICVFTVTCQKNIGSVGRHQFFFFFFKLSAKPEIVVPESDSGNSFSKFPVSRHLFYDELHSFSTFFALNFDKKLAVE